MVGVIKASMEETGDEGGDGVEVRTKLLHLFFCIHTFTMNCFRSRELWKLSRLPRICSDLF